MTNSVDADTPNPDDSYTDERESCTVQEAVAKLIGWMQGKKRFKYIQLNEDGGIVESRLPFLGSLDGTVQDMLEGQWAAARRRLSRAKADALSSQQIDERHSALLDVEEAIQNAATYLNDIEEEIVRGESSELILDEVAEATTGDIHVTLSSLEKWAFMKYGVVMSGELDNKAKTEGTIAKKEPSLKRQLLDKGWLSPPAAANLYTTLAFLVEEVAKQKSIYRSNSGDIFESTVAEQLAEIAKKANNNQYLAGQRKEAILDRIECAMKMQRSKLPVRRT